MKNVKVKCGGCDKEMECPESMLKAEKHFCDECTLKLGESSDNLGNFIKEVQHELDEMGRKFEKCDEMAEEMFDITFWGFWKRMKKFGLEKISKEQLAKEMYLHGASSALGLVICVIHEDGLFDEMKKHLKESKNDPALIKLIRRNKTEEFDKKIEWD